MAQLIFSRSRNSSGEQRYLVQKRMVTVGTEPSHDVMVESGQSGIVFTLTRQAGGACELLPAHRIRINGQSTPRSTALRSCDRIEWEGGAAVYLESALISGLDADEKSAVRSLKLLQNLASTLHGAGAIQAALHQALDALVEMAGAEVGYLLTETPDGSGWELAASRQALESGEAAPNRRELFSNTILKEALERREPVHVENIIGHPWAEAESVIEARIFSAACLPLCVADSIFGAVFLFTRSPGRSIGRESLAELGLVATQAALMLASQAELSSARRENARLRSLVAPGGEGALLVHPESPMTDVARKIQRLAPTPLGVIILGETGTGKEIVAREIHRQSPRAKLPFVAVNCAAIPGALLESTLFGFEKGAFTGATRSQIGKFAQADGGTLFLDEIGDLPLDLQAKLLRVLQEKEVEPIGARSPQKIDVRVVAATHQDLDRAVGEGRFRQDLYFRLNGAVLKLPPLRERPSDIPLLAESFVRKSGREIGFSLQAREGLQKYSWPGNVRELEQVVTRAALLAEGHEITLSDLELDFSRAAGVSATDSSGHPGQPAMTGKLDDAQLAFTRDYVLRALDRHEGNRSLAASTLGISERTLYRILADQADRSGR